MDADAESLSAILDRHRCDPSDLLQILRDAQEQRGYVSTAAISYIARRTGLPRARVEGVAGFYSFLSTAPCGKYRVLFSDNITDRMAGSADLLDRLCHKLWVERGKVSEDGLVSVDTTSCTGMCDQGPAILVNGIAITRLSPSRIDAICELIRDQRPVSDWPAEFFVVEDNIRRADIVLGHDLQPGDAIRASIGRGSVETVELALNERSWRESNLGVARGPAETLEEIKRSNLRGRGGAGFTTGLKWEACRNALGQARYVVCNADEGEPGTFKDRVLLASYADLVVEGMTVAAFAVAGQKGFLYLRGEYRYLLPHLQAVLERRRRDNLLGPNIAGQAGFDFDIDIHVAPAPTSAARNPRSSNRSKASVAFRAIGRPTPCRTAT